MFKLSYKPLTGLKLPRVAFSHDQIACRCQVVLPKIPQQLVHYKSPRAVSHARTTDVTNPFLFPKSALLLAFL